VQAAWQEELDAIVELMRYVSQESDPQLAVQRYGDAARRLLSIDAFVSLSRRGLEAPQYRVTRSSSWAESIDPWLQADRLPVFSDGLLGELCYNDKPVIITDLASRLSPSDPAYSYFAGMKALVALPQYDNGQSLNTLVAMFSDPSRLDFDRIPTMVWQSTLWGRFVLNLVLKRQLDAALVQKRAAFEALDREFKTVGRMQREMLPEKLPKIPGLDLAAHYHTSTRAGGDYYDIFDCGDGRWGMLIADVSGHGTPAAVIMAVTHATAHLHCPKTADPARLLTFLDAQLSARYTREGLMFVTAFYAIFDTRDRTLTYARAGHNPPRLVRSGKVRSLDCVGGVPLGFGLADEPYESQTIPLHAGDHLLLYTDGITEARNSLGDMFGVEQLDAVLCKRCHRATEVIDSVLVGLNSFAGDIAAADDQTLFAASVV
jgi:sigma-B regulation protein RsbU (phosphoserine phosphatase)